MELLTEVDWSLVFAGHNPHKVYFQPSPFSTIEELPSPPQPEAAVFPVILPQEPVAEDTAVSWLGRREKIFCSGERTWLQRDCGVEEEGVSLTQAICLPPRETPRDAEKRNRQLWKFLSWQSWLPLLIQSNIAVCRWTVEILAVCPWLPL